MNEIINKFKEECCSTCKNEHCDKGIVITESYYIDEEKKKAMQSVKCVDYERDESKIQGYEEPIYKTADIEPCVMPKLWSKQ